MALPMCLGPISPSQSCVRRRAIDASADRCRHGFGFAAHPRRDDGAEAASGAAGSDNEQMVGRLQRGMDPVGAVAHDGTLADAGPIAPAHAGAFIEEFADVALLPTCSLNMLAELLG